MTERANTSNIEKAEPIESAAPATVAETPAASAKAALNRARVKAYYERNKTKVNERIKVYRNDDADGTKKAMSRIYMLRHHYKKAPTARKALSLYAALHSIAIEDISLPVSEVIAEMNKL